MIVKWIPLTAITHLDQIEQDSKSFPILIFKHSTRCSISRMAQKSFEMSFDIEGVAAYFLDLIAHRDISNQIATKWHVQHQSPQLLIIKNNEAVYHASHDDIDAGSTKQALAQLLVD